MKKKPTNLKSNADQSSDPLMREARASVELSLKKPVKAQRHYASGGKRKQGWQPIETAPKDGTFILVVEKNFPDVVIVCQFGTFLRGIITDWKSQDGDVVFPWKWMPLPKPPTDER